MQPIAEIAYRNIRTVPELEALQMPPRAAKGGAFGVALKPAGGDRLPGGPPGSG